VVVRGVIDGELSAPDLSVAATGAVEGAIKARRIRSEGRLSGNVKAGEVYLSGTVGDSTVIQAETLEVKLGSGGKPLQVTFGDCNLEVGDDPVKALADGSLTAKASIATTSTAASAASAPSAESASATPLDGASSPPAAKPPSSPSATPPPSRRAAAAAARAEEPSGTGKGSTSATR
jgi:cytoskeletal protein CcmA (bactofilin family)